MNKFYLFNHLKKSKMYQHHSTIEKQQQLAGSKQLISLSRAERERERDDLYLELL